MMLSSKDKSSLVISSCFWFRASHPVDYGRRVRQCNWLLTTTLRIFHRVKWRTGSFSHSNNAQVWSKRTFKITTILFFVSTIDMVVILFVSVASARNLGAKHWRRNLHRDEPQVPHHSLREKRVSYLCRFFFWTSDRTKQKFRAIHCESWYN